jgi:predicted dehydrogenase
MDGVMWIHHPRTNEMLTPICEGSLGILRRVTSGFSFNWDVIPENDIRLKRDMGGGSLLDLGWYCIGATLWAFDSLPQRVFGTGRYYRDVDMSFSGLMWFDDERIASFDCAFDAQFRRWMEVVGATGSLVCDDFTKPWDESRPRFWINTGPGDSVEHVSNSSIQEVCMIEDFCDIVRSGSLVDHWPQRSIAIQRVCDALDRSARECKIVELEG